MKTIIKLGWVIALSFPFMIGLKDKGQKTEWKGKVEEENGVRVIKNPREPMYGQIKLELEEDLSIGGEEDNNYMFYRVRGIAVNNQGDIYVADMSNSRVQKFDKNGKYLKTIGRKGQGPGEFDEPTKILIDETKGNLYVKDGWRIKIFDKEKKYVADIFPKKYPLDFILDGNDSILAKLSSQTESGEFARDFSKISPQGDIIKKYASFPFYYIIQGKLGEGVTVGISGFEHDLSIAAIDDHTFIYGFSKEYKLNVIDREGKPLFRIKKDEPYHEFTSKETSKYKKSKFFYKLPSHKPFYYSLLTDSENRIYVQTNYTMYKPDVDREVDVFNKDGYYLFKTILAHGTYVIGNGFLYAHIVDEGRGLEYVKRFRIKNWDSLKSGI